MTSQVVERVATIDKGLDTPRELPRGVTLTTPLSNSTAKGGPACASTTYLSF